MRTAVASMMVLSTLVAAGGDPVERLTEPRFPPAVDLVDPYDFFTDIVDDGTVFGRTYDPLSGEQPTYLRIGPDGDVVAWNRFEPEFGDMYVLKSFSADGDWGIALTNNYPQRTGCDISGLDGLAMSGTASVRVDYRTNQPEFLSECPGVSATDLSADGSLIVGMLSLEYTQPDNEPYLLGPRHPFVWESGEIRLLDRPELALDLEGSHVSATAVSADGRMIAGGVWATIFDRTDQPFSRAIMWSDGAPQILPHLPNVEGDVVASGASDLSSDGTTIIGHTRGYDLEPRPWGPDEWVPREPRAWRYRDGVFDELGMDGVTFGAHSVTSDGSMVRGSADVGLIDRLPLVWTERYGSMTAGDFLRRVGIDLDGQEIRHLISVSDNGHWMLVTLRVGDGLEQDARLRVPCSPADLTADRMITLDDLLAYAERFASGNELADLSGDGLLDLADIVAFLTFYADGCPG